MEIRAPERGGLVVALIARPSMAHDVFISYSARDAEPANAVVELFEAAGFPCWIAPRDPVAGEPYSKQIVNAIEASRCVLLLLSQNSNASKAVLGEIELASNRNRKIVPVRIENVQPTEALEYYIRSVHWFDAIAPPLEIRLRPLIDSLPVILGDAPVGAAMPAAPRVAGSPTWRAQGRGPFAFLFTDVEGSTKLWEADAAAMSRSLERHDVILRTAILEGNGRVFKTVGDAFCAAFETALEATNAAVEAQRALHEGVWDSGTGRLKVRMGIHVGEAEQRAGDFFGPTLNRVARLSSAAYADQILLSDAARRALPEGACEFVDLGEHRLKDLAEPLRVYQLLVDKLPRDFPPLRSIDVRRTNLPVQPNELLGRERELARASELLRESALLSVVATGGIGKTRFALQLAADVSDDYPDGVWLADFSALERGDLVASTVARVLDVPEQSGVSLVAAIASALESKRTLLVLDNCEHVIDDVARLIVATAARAKGVRFIATSREPIAIAAERQLRLSPLAVPDVHASPRELMESPSVRLFIERARALNAAFAFDDAALRTIVEICTRLDGIPLAIELAAARTGLFDVRDLAEKMDDLLRLLAQKRRDAAPRQQTLEALVDWSYRLLDDLERTAFERLGTFAGPFAIAAALEVCAFGDLDELDFETSLESLIEKSFIVVEGDGDARRLKMFETIRQFAEKRLRKDASSRDEAAARHVAYYSAFAERATTVGREDLGAFRASLSNVRAALREALASATAATEGVALALGIARYSLQVGALTEGSAALASARAIEGLDPARIAWIEFVMGEFSMHLGRVDEAAAHYAAVVERDLPETIGRAHFGLARIELARGNTDAARALIDTSIAENEAVGNAFGAFAAITESINIDLAAGRRHEARAGAEHAYELARGLGDRAISFGAGNVATLALYDNDLDRAATLIDTAIAAAERSHSRLSVAYYTCIRSEIALFAGAGDPASDARRALAIAFEAEASELAVRCAETLAAVAGSSGERDAARTLLAWVDSMRRSNGDALDDADDRAIIERKRKLAGGSSDADQALVEVEDKSDGDLLSFVKGYS